jgi:hypothetical protein
MPTCFGVFVTEAARLRNLFRMAVVPMLGFPPETGLLIA